MLRHSPRWRYCVLVAGATVIGSLVGTLRAADELPVVNQVDLQPLQAQARRIDQALQLLGAPLDEKQQAALKKALAETDAAKGIAAIQAVLDPLCLVGVDINPESRVKVQQGPAPAKLAQQGWRVFLVKVHNQAGVRAELRVSSPNAQPVYKRSSGKKEPPQAIKPKDVTQRWLDVAMFNAQPLVPKLSSLPLEYRVIQIFSRDAGKREAKLVFDVGQGTQDLGFRAEVNILFDCAAAVPVTLEVIDDDGKPTTGQFIIRDEKGRVYPSRTKRLAPDFFFHDQVYRQNGETVDLPPGKYEVVYTRGPEYLIQQRTITVPDAEKHTETFRLKRWIKLTDYGWYSGDHHVHAAGCAHYESPTEGVTPEVMMRHILGEDLNVGCVLTWGPCWYAQKKFFDGSVSQLSTDKYKMRYDIEVSGFPSDHCGHLCLLRLKEDDYPGTTRTEQWPSWDLPILQWGKKQGAVVGFSHSGWGLAIKEEKLPSYEMPPFDGIGANEYIVDVCHDAVDFISAVDTPVLWEMNIWYHTLNCGFTTRISGETDFPCIYGDRVGLGRGYVKLKDQPLDFDAWIAGIKAGRSYCGDGRSHLIDFTVNGLGVGEKGDGGRESFLATKAGEKLKITVKAAALLQEKPRDDIRNRKLHDKPYWDVERARIGDSKQVPVELVVNGQAVARQEMPADGKVRDLTFDYTPDRSSWVALRIFPACHTNPVFVEVDGQPIRSSKKSAEWCLKAVDVCWNSKKPRIRENERKAAAAAYDVARKRYQRILAESKED